MHSIVFPIIFILLALSGSAGLSQSCQQDSIAQDTKLAATDYHSVRGLERDAMHPGNTARTALNGVLWLPRETIGLAMTLAGAGAVIIDEKNIVSKFEDIFYISGTRIGWFPVLNVISGFPRGYGLSLFYRDEITQTSIKSAYRNSDVWGLRSKFSHLFFYRGYVWRVAFNTRIENDRGYQFYGFGADPARDPRNHFLQGDSYGYGTYNQRRQLLESILGIRPTANNEFFITTIYMNREIRSTADNAEQDIARVFDLSRLPGSRGSFKSLYGELSWRYDSRSSVRRILPGQRLQVYSGYSIGLGRNDVQLTRAGADLAWFIPIIRRNRLLIPRIIANTTWQSGGDSAASFLEYPRHMSFRGVDRKQLLRSDRYSVTTGLEYKWPLTYHLHGSIYYDRLLVARRLPDFTIKNAPWALGLGFDFNTRDKEIAHAFIAWGSEGFFARLAFGIEKRFRGRSDWN